MPYFTPDVEDLVISPGEFLEKCSEKDLQETFDQLIENYGFNSDENPDEKSIRSETHRIFLKNLQYLRQNWYSVSKEDSQIIDVIAKNYGAL